MLSLEQRGEALRRVDELMDKASQYYGQEFEMPTVDFGLRGTKGGVAMGLRWEIRLNSVLMHENWDDYMEDTIPHELAHLIVYRMWGVEYRTARTGRKTRVSHGARWKSVMSDCFNVAPNRCHTMDTTNAACKSRQQEKFEYRCTCCGTIVPVGPKHHAKLLRGAQMYHKGCKGASLEYVGALGRVSWAEAAQGKKAEGKNDGRKVRKVRKPAKPMDHKKPTLIGRATQVYKDCMVQGIEDRAGVIEQIMLVMNVKKERATAYYGDIVRKGLAK